MLLKWLLKYEHCRDMATLSEHSGDWGHASAVVYPEEWI